MDSISLTPGESELFNDLRAARSRAHLDHVEMRVVGGWCRDKMLGVPAGDIDICLSSMTGREFAEQVCQLSWPGTKFGVVSSNPDKSKHLETAVLRIGNRMIDLTHLRTEQYTDYSRVPLVKFGTLLEDSLRRDCTINSLFYNLDSCVIEDPTGLGVQDLKSGIIRTPTDPLVTFTDDPLRLLRVIRFASALGFEIDPKTQSSFQDKRVLEGLMHKVSRERILIEFDKMLLLEESGFRRAMSLLEEVEGLFGVVLFPGVRWKAIDIPDAVEACAKTDKLRLATRIAAFLMVHCSGVPSMHILRHRLMWPSERSSTVGNLFKATDSFRKLGLNPSFTDLKMWAREAGPELWEVSLMLSAMLSGEWDRVFRVRDELSKVLDRVFLPSLLPGDEIAKLRGLKGKEIFHAKLDLIRWQMDAPEGQCNQDGARRYLASKS